MCRTPLTLTGTGGLPSLFFDGIRTLLFSSSVAGHFTDRHFLLREATGVAIVSSTSTVADIRRIENNHYGVHIEEFIGSTRLFLAPFLWKYATHPLDSGKEFPFSYMNQTLIIL